jgi:hypothetical protein
MAHSLSIASANIGSEDAKAVAATAIANKMETLRKGFSPHLSPSQTGEVMQYNLRPSFKLKNSPSRKRSKSPMTPLEIARAIIAKKEKLHRPWPCYTITSTTAPSPTPTSPSATSKTPAMTLIATTALQAISAHVTRCTQSLSKDPLQVAGYSEPSPDMKQTAMKVQRLLRKNLADDSPIAPTPNGFWIIRSYVRANPHLNPSTHEIMEIYRGRTNNITPTPYYLQVARNNPPEMYQPLIIPPLLYRPYQHRTKHPIWAKAFSGKQYEMHRNVPIFLYLIPRKQQRSDEYISFSVQSTTTYNSGTPLRTCSRPLHHNASTPTAPVQIEATLSCYPWTKRLQTTDDHGNIVFTTNDFTNVTGFYIASVCLNSCHSPPGNARTWYLHIKAQYDGINNIHMIIPIKSMQQVKLPAFLDRNAMIASNTYLPYYNLETYQPLTIAAPPISS